MTAAAGSDPSSRIRHRRWSQRCSPSEDRSERFMAISELALLPLATSCFTSRGPRYEGTAPDSSPQTAIHSGVRLTQPARRSGVIAPARCKQCGSHGASIPRLGASLAVRSREMQKSGVGPDRCCSRRQAEAAPPQGAAENSRSTRERSTRSQTRIEKARRSRERAAGREPSPRRHPSEASRRGLPLRAETLPTGAGGRRGSSACRRGRALGRLGPTTRGRARCPGRTCRHAR